MPKILIRTPNHLGDAVMALPMINETREAHPGSSVTVLTPEHLADLFVNNPAVDEVIRIPSRYVHGLVAVMRIKNLLAPHRFDIGYILPPSFGSASGFKLGGVTERIGYVTDGRRLLLTRPLALPTPMHSAHRSETYFNLLRRASAANLEFSPPKVFLNDEDIGQGAKLLEGLGLRPLNRYVVFGFRAVAESRRWGTAKFANLAKRLIAEYGVKVVLIGSADDRSEGEEIAQAAGGKEVVNLAGKTTLRELAAVISTGHLYVGVDSGPAHLAAAVGATMVCFIGAADPRETVPYSKRCRVIYLDHLECRSCVKNRCPLSGEAFMRCMKDITVEMAMQEAKEAIGQPS